MARWVLLITAAFCFSGCIVRRYVDRSARMPGGDAFSPGEACEPELVAETSSVPVGQSLALLVNCAAKLSEARTLAVVPASGSQAVVQQEVHEDELEEGRIELPIPSSLAAGSYRARLFEGLATGQWLAQSNAFSVTTPSSGGSGGCTPRVTLDKASYLKSESVVATWQCLSQAKPGAWAGIFKTTSLEDPNSFGWTYLAGPASTGTIPPANGSVSIRIAASVAGTYRVRLHLDPGNGGGYLGALGMISEDFSISESASSANCPQKMKVVGTAKVGSALQIEFCGLDSDAYWMGLYRDGEQDLMKTVAWAYVPPVATGTISMMTSAWYVAPGAHFLRVFNGPGHSKPAQVSGVFSISP